jgi:hypothetical protein
MGDLDEAIWHWRDGSWHRVAWDSWMRFRGLAEDGWAPLPHVRAGEHYFVSCAAEDGGSTTSFRIVTWSMMRAASSAMVTSACYRPMRSNVLRASTNNTTHRRRNIH